MEDHAEVQTLSKARVHARSQAKAQNKVSAHAELGAKMKVSMEATIEALAQESVSKGETLSMTFSTTDTMKEHKTLLFKDSVRTNDMDTSFPLAVLRQGNKIKLQTSGTQLHAKSFLIIGDKPLPTTLVKTAPFKNKDGSEGLEHFWEATIPYTAPIGIHTLYLRFSFEKMKTQPTLTAKCGQVYLIFNPYAPESPVYVKEESARFEYIENTVGRLWKGGVDEEVVIDGETYSGNFIGVAGVASIRWAYDQDTSFDIIFKILNTDFAKQTLPESERHDPVKVSRALTHLLNYDSRKNYPLTPKDKYYVPRNPHGVMMGNWGEADDGVMDVTEWSGSLELLSHWAKDQRPVRYAQCWIFAGVLTTALRALGIASRPVTNFRSAHDKQPVNIIIDSHESVWDFHVWVDAWFKRDDMKKPHGWNAVDATPQEMSGNRYLRQMGPAYLEDVRNNKADTSYDTAFVIAETNARKCLKDKGKCSPTDHESAFDDSRVGVLMSTKQPGCGSTWIHDEKYSAIKGHACREDVTKEYKTHEHGLVQSTSLLEEGGISLKGLASKAKSLFQKGWNDILAPFLKRVFKPRNPEFAVVFTPKNPMVGEDVKITVANLVEGARKGKKVKIELDISFVSYTGLVYKKLPTVTKEVELGAEKKDIKEKSKRRKECESKCPKRGDLEAALTKGETCDTLLSSLSPHCQVFCRTSVDYRHAKISKNAVFKQCQNAKDIVVEPSISLLEHVLTEDMYRPTLKNHAYTVVAHLRVSGEGIIKDELMVDAEKGWIVNKPWRISFRHPLLNLRVIEVNDKEKIDVEMKENHLSREKAEEEGVKFLEEQDTITFPHHEDSLTLLCAKGNCDTHANTVASLSHIPHHVSILSQRFPHVRFSEEGLATLNQKTSLTIEATFTNPLEADITNCYLTVSAPGTRRARHRSGFHEQEELPKTVIGTVKKEESVTKRISINTGTTPGRQVTLVNVKCDQLSSFKGSIEFDVKLTEKTAPVVIKQDLTFSKDEEEKIPK